MINSPESSAVRPRLVLRADGNARIGLGHVMRLLALAGILRPQFHTVFAVQEPSLELRQLLATACDEVVEVPPVPYDGEPAWLAQHVLQGADILVLDGYGFEYAYQQAVRAAVARLVCLDDLHSFPFAADLVLNPAGGVSASAYELRQPGARLLSGPQYAPLQPPFLKTEPSQMAPTHTVLVCLGGADPTHQTQHVAQAMLELAAVRQLHAVVGSAYAGWEALQQWSADQPRLQLHRNLPAAALAALMRECGTAICSPSTISYEYCAAGGGLLFVQPTAANQHDLDHFLRAEGLALPYHAAANVLTSPEAGRVAERLRQAQQLHFDGQAPQRLCQAFATLQLPAAPLHLRRVSAEDSDLLLTWTNDPEVRQRSFNPSPVPRIEHEKWFVARLADANSLLLIAEDIESHEPAGLIRFGVEGEQATLSYQLAGAYRGRGLAAALLAAGTEALRQQFPAVRRVVGHVQRDNLPSVRAFRRAGYQELPEPLTAHADSLTFAWIF